MKPNTYHLSPLSASSPVNIVVLEIKSSHGHYTSQVVTLRDAYETIKDLVRLGYKEEL